MRIQNNTTDYSFTLISENKRDEKRLRAFAKAMTPKPLKVAEIWPFRFVNVRAITRWKACTQWGKWGFPAKEMQGNYFLRGLNGRYRRVMRRKVLKSTAFTKITP